MKNMQMPRQLVPVMAAIGGAQAEPFKANGAYCDSQFWREQAPAKTCDSRGSTMAR
jgi:hypothetical protein